MKSVPQKPHWVRARGRRRRLAVSGERRLKSRFSVCEQGSPRNPRRLRSGGDRAHRCLHGGLRLCRQTSVVRRISSAPDSRAAALRSHATKHSNGSALRHCGEVALPPGISSPRVTPSPSLPSPGDRLRSCRAPLPCDGVPGRGRRAGRVRRPGGPAPLVAGTATAYGWSVGACGLRASRSLRSGLD